jgi:hypothetical protein
VKRASPLRFAVPLASLLAAGAFAAAPAAAAPEGGATSAGATPPVAAVVPATLPEPHLPEAPAPAPAPPQSAPAPPQSGWALLRAEPPALVAALLEEKIVLLDGPRGPHKHGGGMSHAYVVFEQPAARAFELLADTARQGEYREEIDRLETVARLPDGCIDEHAIRILFVELVYRLRYHVDPVARRIAWQLDATFENPLGGIDGFWEIYELGPSRSLGRFGTSVDVGSALPAWLEEAVTRKNLPNTLEGCRRWVDAGGEAP